MHLTCLLVPVLAWLGTKTPPVQIQRPRPAQKAALPPAAIGCCRYRASLVLCTVFPMTHRLAHREGSSWFIVVHRTGGDVHLHTICTPSAHGLHPAAACLCRRPPATRRHLGAGEDPMSAERQGCSSGRQRMPRG
jgi:hypothetical protein